MILEARGERLPKIPQTVCQALQKRHRLAKSPAVEFLLGHQHRHNGQGPLLHEVLMKFVPCLGKFPMLCEIHDQIGQGHRSSSIVGE